MFKKTEPESGRTEPIMKTTDQGNLTPSRKSDSATIGPSIRINGDLTGNEDVVVQGSVEGTINLRENVLIIGKDGHINATVNARVINVEGKVEGDLHGDEQVIVQQSGNVRGNITAPRVTLEDGCKFKGSIDMDVEASAKSSSESSQLVKNVADIKSASESAAKAGLGLGKGPGQ
jgi:cytoskeletal protein CcmA (bactofilin family)